MKKLIVVVLLMLYTYGCDSSGVQSNNVVVPDNPDSVVSEYKNGIEFLGRYSENLHPNLRIDSSETYAGSTPPYIARGTLFVYYNDQLIDSIPYGYGYHQWFGGVSHPSVRAGYVNAGNEYLLKVQNEYDGMYIAGRNLWYIINSTGIHLLPKVTATEENGIYENNQVRAKEVRKSTLSHRIIFLGECYCNKQAYTTFDLSSTFKNFYRTRPDCYDEWQWQ